jgi:hypothetical protein
LKPHSLYNAIFSSILGEILTTKARRHKEDFFKKPLCLRGYYFSPKKNLPNARKTYNSKKLYTENKTVDTLVPVHEAQLLTYLKLNNCWLGYLINWNTSLIRYGIRRKVNGQKPEF